MLVRDLDGNSFDWKLTGYMAKSQTVKSGLHLITRKLLHEIYPTLMILEEVTVALRSREHVFLDFYLPLSRLAIEVHGKQHYEFNKFYHGSIHGFFKQKKRDKDKRSWCEMNNIRLAELPYNDIDNWEDIIRGGTTNTRRENTED